jgi:16S rRNA (guanine966-N2)-methyltransferase
VRIIAGTAKGRVLKVPRNTEVRPTADRVKETIFNVLGQWLDGEAVLDLYAGVGGLALEALSRGAERVTCVERDKIVLATLAENIRALGFAAQASTLLKSSERAIAWLGARAATFSLVFSDPPYASEVGAMTLQSLDKSGVLKDGARIVIEHSRHEALPEQVGSLERVDERRFGETTVSFYALRSKVLPEHLRSPEQ